MQDLFLWLMYYLVGIQFDKKMLDGSQGISYQVKYLILVIIFIIIDGDSRDIFEGMNSVGLLFSENMIMNVQLLLLFVSEYKQVIFVILLGEWVLVCFVIVGEVKQVIKEGKFWLLELYWFGDLKLLFYYVFYDKKGGSIVVEVENGKFYVYDNFICVMINGFVFFWYLINLNNYM